MSAKQTKRERYFRELLEAYDPSTGTLKQYLLTKGVDPQSGYWWRGELRRRDLLRRPARAPAPESGPSLIPVDLVREPSPQSFEVVLAGGRRITVGAGFDAHELSRLVATLERC